MLYPLSYAGKLRKDYTIELDLRISDEGKKLLWGFNRVIFSVALAQVQLGLGGGGQGRGKAPAPTEAQNPNCGMDKEMRQSKHGSLAQLAEQGTLNAKVRGSSPWRVIFEGRAERGRPFFVCA